jgi:hypothetical protein
VCEDEYNVRLHFNVFHACLHTREVVSTYVQVVVDADRVSAECEVFISQHYALRKFSRYNLALKTHLHVLINSSHSPIISTVLQASHAFETRLQSIPKRIVLVNDLQCKESDVRKAISPTLTVTLVQFICVKMPQMRCAW